MNRPPDVSVGILAGGGSTRMGTDKALLRLGNRTVIERIADEFRCSHEVLIAAAESETYAFLGLPVVCDENRGIGPIEGLRRLLTAAGEDYVFVCAADMPFIRREIVGYLTRYIRPGVDCCVLTVNGNAEPLCAIYSKSILPVIEEQIGQGRYRLRDIYKHCCTEYIPLEDSGLDPSMVRNMNTPEHYRLFADEFHTPVHVFLTGDQGIGKSETVQRIAALLGRPCYGFLTRFRHGDHTASPLYMVPAEIPGLLDEDHIVAVWQDGRLKALPERFDALGAAFLQEARKHPEGLILMDECGHLEKNASGFRKEILDCLNGPVPVLGVLRKDQPWHSFIKEHPRVQIVEVTEENRDTLPALAAELLGRTK